MAMILTESGFVTQSQKESIQSNKYKYDIDLDLAVDSKKQYSKLVDKFKRQNDDIQIDVDFDAIYNGLNLRTNNFETLCKALRDLYVGGDFSGTDGLAFMIFGNDFSYVTPKEKAIIKKYDPEGYEMDFGEDVESKSIKEDADKNYNPVDTVDIAVDNVIENIVNSELGNLAQQIAALGKGYNADWCAVEADSPTSQAVVKALENLGDALKADLLANYNKNESLKESIEDEYASITALADDCGENVFKEFSTGLRFRFMNDDNAIKFMDKLREMNITFDEMATGVIRVDKVNLVSESFNDEVSEYNEHQYKVEKRHVYKRQVRTSYFDSYDEAKLDAEEWINDADKHLKIYAKGLTNSAFAYIYHWNGTEFEYIELINSETIEKERKSVKESFDYNENSEEDQGLFDGIGTQVVDTIFPGVQFEGKEMEKLDDAIDNLIWVYKSVKARSSKAVKESVDNKHYKNVNTVNGKNVVAAHLSSEHTEYKDTYLGYVSFELDDGSDAYYPVDLDGNLVDDKNAWKFIKKKGLPEVTFGNKTITESIDDVKDIKNLIKSWITGKNDGGGQNSAYFAKWLANAEAGIDDWEKIAEVAYLMGYDVYETQFGYEGDRDYLIVYPGANPNVYATDLEDKDFWEEVKKTLTLVESFDKKSIK